MGTAKSCVTDLKMGKSAKNIWRKKDYCRKENLEGCIILTI